MKVPLLVYFHWKPVKQMKYLCKYEHHFDKNFARVQYFKKLTAKNCIALICKVHNVLILHIQICSKPNKCYGHLPGSKYLFTVNNKDPRIMSISVVLMSLSLTLNRYFIKRVQVWKLGGKWLDLTILSSSNTSSW